MRNTLQLLIVVLLANSFGGVGQARAGDVEIARQTKAPAVTTESNATQADLHRLQNETFPARKISLAPFPATVFLQKGQRPIFAFITPCVQMEKLTHNSQIFIAFETMMFQMIANINDTNILPLEFEPVCT
jgi:hypothetical protein